MDDLRKLKRKWDEVGRRIATEGGKTKEIDITLASFLDTFNN